MKTLNLLPHHIKQYKRARKQKIFFAVLQIAILLCIGAVFLVINIQERALVNRSHVLIASLAEFDDYQLLIVEELDTAITLMQNFDDFYTANFPVTFETLWFEVIMQTLPQGSNISRLRYLRAEILMQGYVPAIADIDIYRRALLGANIFENIRSGDVDLQSCGRFSFVLHAVVHSNEQY